MESWFAGRSVGRLLPGDHDWFSYSSHEEQEHVIGAFLRDGQLTMDKVIYVADADPRDLPGLHGKDCLDPGGFLRTGQLTVLPRAETCLTAGAIEPGRKVASHEKELDRA